MAAIFSKTQLLTLKICGVVMAIGLTILGIDRFIVQPSKPGSEVSIGEIEANVEVPEVDLGLDKVVDETRREIDQIMADAEAQRQARAAAYAEQSRARREALNKKMGSRAAADDKWENAGAKPEAEPQTNPEPKPASADEGG